MLDRAERAATAGDLASADELLAGAARLQEKELGPHHPDLANTLNNLAIVAERAGRPAEAETLYRRAAAIAAAAFPPDHPMVVASTQNLEDFCRARGLPIKAPVADRTVRGSEPALSAVAPEPPPAVPMTSAAGRAPDTGVAVPAAPSPSAEPLAPPSAEPAFAPAADVRTPPPPRTGARSSPSLVWVASGVVVLITTVLLMLRPGSPPDASRTASTPAADPAVSRPGDAAPPPAEATPARPSPAKAARRDRTAAAKMPPAANEPSAATGVSLATAQLCRTLSTSGGTWRCTPAGGSVKPGPLVLYTRVKSSRNGAVMHRWYQGDTLRRSVRLATRASATEGYRTYSRQSVTSGDWRVEVSSANGTLLHAQKFAVR